MPGLLLHSTQPRNASTKRALLTSVRFLKSLKNAARHRTNLQNLTARLALRHWTAAPIAKRAIVVVVNDTTELEGQS
ncbi:hypothetical protein EJB05_13650, partial [Eragrostis curvula]